MPYGRLERDELSVIRQLQDIESSSAAVIAELQLTRQIVKEVYRQLMRDRAAKLTLTKMLGATRSKYADGGTCWRCGVQEVVAHKIAMNTCWIASGYALQREVE